MMEGDVSAIKGHSIKTMVVDDPVDPLKHPSLETASGTRLDALAYPLGVSRADGETDAQLRKRAKIAAVWKMKNPTTAAGLPPWGKTETPETFASKFQRFAAGDKEE